MATQRSAGARAADPATAAPLAAGLNRIAAGMLATVLLLGGGTAWTAFQIRDHVTRLNAVNAVHESRDLAFHALTDQPRNLTPAETGRVGAVFMRLRADMERALALSPDDPDLRAAQAAAEEVLDRFGDAEEAKTEAAARIAEVRRGIALFYRKSAEWKRIVDRAEVEAAALARRAEDRQRETSGVLGALAAATLSATRIQREVEAVARYNASDAGRRIPLETAAVSPEGIPPVCERGAPDSPGRLCNPSSARVHSALVALRAAPSRALKERLDRALWALEAYGRAGEARFSGLSEDLTMAVDRSQAARRQLERASRTIGGLTRLNRVAADADEMLRNTVPAPRNIWRRRTAA